MEKTKAEGKILLMIVGIFMLIGAVINVFTSVPVFAFLGEYDYGSMTGVLAFSGVWGLVGAVLEFFTGITGIKKGGSLEEQDIKKCQKWGIIMMAFAVITLVINICMTFAFFTEFSFTSFFGLLLPILYLIGVYLNKNSKRKKILFENLNDVNGADTTEEE